MRRTEARELFMQLLFQMEIHDDYGQEIKEKFINENVKIKNSDQLDYFNRLFNSVTQNLSIIDRLLEDCSENWKVNRIAKVDLAVLRLSIAEILYLDDVPDSAAINEAIELVKKYSGEDSGKFINGILGKVVRSKDAN